MRLGIDLDGVACDFGTPANLFIAGYLGRPLLRITTWNWFELYGEGGEAAWKAMWRHFEQRHTFAELVPYPGAIECLHKLSEKHRLFFLTSRPAWAKADTEEWLERYGLDNHELLFTERPQDKLAAAREARLQRHLDDYPATVVDFNRLGRPGFGAVLFKRPWNTEFWLTEPSVTSWSEFTEAVESW